MVPFLITEMGPKWYNFDHIKGTHLRVFLLSLGKEMSSLTIGENGDDYRGRLRSHSQSLLP